MSDYTATPTPQRCIRGAARSKGGLPIIALPSTAKGGSISRIVPQLQPGAFVRTCASRSLSRPQAGDLAQSATGCREQVRRDLVKNLWGARNPKS